MEFCTRHVILEHVRSHLNWQQTVLGLTQGLKNVDNLSSNSHIHKKTQTHIVFDKKFAGVYHIVLFSISVCTYDSKLTLLFIKPFFCFWSFDLSDDNVNFDVVNLLLWRGNVRDIEKKREIIKKSSTQKRDVKIFTYCSHWTFFAEYSLTHWIVCRFWSLLINSNNNTKSPKIFRGEKKNKRNWWHLLTLVYHKFLFYQPTNFGICDGNFANGTITAAITTKTKLFYFYFFENSKVQILSNTRTRAFVCVEVSELKQLFGVV